MRWFANAPLSDQPPRTLPPSWADPRAILAVSAFRWADVDLLALAPGRLAVADPKRIAIGFNSTEAKSGIYQVAPWADADVSGFPVSLLAVQQWFDVFTYGPMVSGEWWGFASLDATARVLELYLLSGV